MTLNGPTSKSAINSINLKSLGELPRGYESGHITGFKYNISSMPSERELCDDLDFMFTVYDAVREVNDNLRSNTKINRITLSRDVKAKASPSELRVKDQGFLRHVLVKSM